MKLRMAENSLFAILLRKPWWVSILLAAVVSLALAAILPRAFAPYGASAGMPFLIIGVIAAVRQWRVPSATAIARTNEALRGMNWTTLASAVEQTYRKQGYEVRRLNGAADFSATRGGREILISARRWKAASTGMEHLRELSVALEAGTAQEAVCLSIAGVGGPALQFAWRHRIRIVSGAELAQLMQGVAGVKD